jgi:hypothetical protein
MKYVKPKVTALLVLFIALFSCKKDPVNPPPAIDLSQVRMNDFQLVETAYANITVTHPVISNGTEVQQGEIRVTVPQGTMLGQLAPKLSNFTNSDFTVSPQLGVQQNFLNRVVIYTIVSKQDASKRVHYAVTITEAQTPPNNQTALTSFRFEKAKNPFLPADVDAARIIEGVGTIGKVFVFVPAGTAFSSLTPTIGFQGTGLFYSQDPASVPENSTTVYPAAGTAIDFAYPKVFYAIVKNGTTVKTYSVIVDVKAPIRFDNQAVTTPDVQAGSIHSVQATTFLNVGNHPISIIGVDHSNQVPVGSNAVRGAGFVPSFGLRPGDRGNVLVTISAQTWPAGTYGVTASFKPHLVDHPEADNLLEGTPLRITSTIVQ